MVIPYSTAKIYIHHIIIFLQWWVGTQLPSLIPANISGFIVRRCISPPPIHVPHSNGDQYDGDWVMGKRHGHGLLRTAQGTIYDVSWHMESCIAQLNDYALVPTCMNYSCRVSGGVMCTMVKDQSCTHLESLMRECGSTEDQQVSCLCVLDFQRFYIIRRHFDHNVYTVEPPQRTLWDTDCLYTMDKPRALIVFAIEITHF